MIFLAKRLGRFATLILFAATLLVLGLWLQLLDIAPVAFLVLAPITILAFCASLALLTGLLFVQAPRNGDRELSRSEAPALWAIWDAYDPAASGERSLRVDEHLNASISERKKWFGLFGRQTTMTIGLELLILADERLLRTVIAHEVGHARHQHTTGGTNLAEFLQTFETLLDYADPDTTIVGRLADWGVGAWLNRASRELMRLSRQNEFEADLVAAELCGSDAAADAEVFMATLTKAVEAEVYLPLEQELVGAIRAPVPPSQRVKDRRPQLVSQETQALYLTEAWRETVVEDASHPAFRDRFENISPGETPIPVAVGPSAAGALLPPNVFDALMQQAAKAWTSQVEGSIGIY